MEHPQFAIGVAQQVGEVRDHRKAIRDRIQHDGGQIRVSAVIVDGDRVVIRAGAVGIVAVHDRQFERVVPHVVAHDRETAAVKDQRRRSPEPGGVGDCMCGVVDASAVRVIAVHDLQFVGIVISVADHGVACGVEDQRRVEAD